MRKEDGFLNIKEPRRVYVMEQVMQGKITVRHAAEVLGLSERQINWQHCHMAIGVAKPDQPRGLSPWQTGLGLWSCSCLGPALFG
jgi:hypothetical protein